MSSALLVPVTLFYLIGAGLFFTGCTLRPHASDALPVSHAKWDSLVQTHVSPDGWVDYRGFRADSTRLREYLELLRENHPNEQNWTREESMAYWINAYNAFTVKLVLDHYPVESIKDIRPGIPFINSVWDIKFIEIEGRTYDLNNIEHGILRNRYQDPRIHFALNCASVSCPLLRGEAYTADQLDAQLDGAGRQFLTDPLRNRTSDPTMVELSSIFKWYRGDFTRADRSLVDFLNRFVPTPINEEAEINYLDYDWRLNDLQHAERPR